MRQRVLAVLQGEKPDRTPFIDRIDFWYKGRTQVGKLPLEFQGMTLPEVHGIVGMGHQDWDYPYAIKYKKLEIILTFEGERIFQEVDPEITNFPTLWGWIPIDKPGVTTTELITPVGKLSFQHRLLKESISTGTTRPQMISHPIKDLHDFKIYEYIIENSEFVPRYEAFTHREDEIGDHGYLVPIIERIPFQHLLIDAIGELETFYMLHDNPKEFRRLLGVIDEQVTDKLKRLADFSAPYVEFTDNLDGFMTNPLLFQEYVLPAFQSYCEILHGQGKKVGDHTDGDLKAIVHLLPETDLDVCESFTPAPTTSCTFEEAWKLWKGGPIIWGGIASYYLEDRVSEVEFREHIEHLLQLIGDSPIILGVGDAVMSDNDIDRVRYIAERIENHPI
ncbi:MAG: hypothetical protein JSV37_13320 [Anaerolineaceae bacterium]|nr:MAG: hypothetical protein JSV37_13320 [Anaerolineaceae bacterium]